MFAIGAGTTEIHTEDFEDAIEKLEEDGAGETVPSAGHLDFYQ